MDLQLADEFTTSWWVYNQRMSVQLLDEFTTSGWVYNCRMSLPLVDEFTTSGDELFQWYKYRMRSSSAKVFTYLLYTLKKGPLVIPVTLEVYPFN